MALTDSNCVVRRFVAMTILLAPLRTPLRVLRDWPVTSQSRACRNAMVASTVLAQRRAERVEVEEFLARAHVRDSLPGAGSAPLPPGLPLDPAPGAAHG